MTKKAVKSATQLAEQPEVITSYKGFDQELKCRGFQYEIGGHYDHPGEVVACPNGDQASRGAGGFHACEYPLHVLRYYKPNKSRFGTVEQSGTLARHDDDSKVASSHIHIKAEITLTDLIKAAVKFTLDRCTPAEGAISAEQKTVVKAEGLNKSATASGYYGAATASG